MKPAQRFTAIIEREDDAFVALCPEFDIASQGASIEEARANLIEALTLSSLQKPIRCSGPRHSLYGQEPTSRSYSEWVPIQTQIICSPARLPRAR